jgi:hypothetical protein
MRITLDLTKTLPGLLLVIVGAVTSTVASAQPYSGEFYSCSPSNGCEVAAPFPNCVYVSD